MNPTLREILAYEPFRRADARVVVGEQGLDRQVRWVHSTEMPSPGRMFHGGELLLTQGRGLSGNESEQRAWVQSLAEAHLVGVGIELGVSFDTLPSALVEEAGAIGLVVIELRHPAYFMDMTEAVHSSIVDAQYGQLQRADVISRRFSRLALEGAGLTEMIGELARAVDHPVVLSDEAHELVAFAPETAALTGRSTDLVAHARFGHSDQPDGTPARTTAAGVACVWMPIVVRGQLWGTIHLVEDDRPADDVATLTLDRAASAIGLAFASATDIERQQQDARSAFVHDLLGGHYADIREMRLKATTFGFALSGRLRVLVLRPLDSAPQHSEGLRHPLRAISSVTNRVLSQDARPLIGYDGGQIVVLAAESATLLDRIQAIVTECAHRHGIQLLAGVSDAGSVPDLPQAFADAAEVVRYGMRTGHGRGVLTPDGLGIDRLLLDLDRGPTLSRHVQRELGDLLDHDASSGSPLLPTLAAYLDHNGSKAEAARELNIARRALYYRLTRLEEVLGASLEDADTRLRLHIALRGRDFRRRSREQR